ncbi:MAG: branched-chain amino acid ABC transporter substrate-binding protein, partial [Hyphomicrobium sp.]
MKSATIFAALALACVAVFAGCDSGPAKLKLGVAGPMTGTDAAFGAQLKNGAEQAVADINAAGGINGQQIELTVGDDAADPRQGVSVANNFLGEGIHFVVGHFNSGVSMPASEVYVDNGILMITPSSTNPMITERKLWNVFRTCGRDDQQGGVAGKYIAEHLKDKKVAIVHDKTTYGKGLADETKKAMNNLGVTEVVYEGVSASEKDFAALVSKLKNSGVEVLYWGGVHTAGGLVLRQMRD